MNKIAELKKFFLKRTIVFKVMTAIRYLPKARYQSYFVLQYPIQFVILQKFHKTKKDNVKTAVKDKNCKTFNYILREIGVEAVITLIYNFKDFETFNSAVYRTPIM